MEIKNKLKYQLTDRLGILAVVPLGESDFSLEYERENDDKLSYKMQLSGKIVFKGEAFQRIMQMENSIYRCEEQTLTILKDCNGNEKTIFVGKISLNEGEFNLDKCEVVLKYSDDNTDKCYDDGKSKKVNLFQLIYNRITVKTASFVGVIEEKNCNKNGTTQFETNYWCGTGDPYSQNWSLVSWKIMSPDGTHHSVKNTWKREIIEIGCSDSIDPEWVLIEDNCGTTGKKKFAKKVALFNCVYSIYRDPSDADVYNWSSDCKVLGYEGTSATIDNGVLFSDVIQELVRSACPNLIVKSDFFQIDPEVVSSINYVTGKVSTVNNIVIFQKSDVKRLTDYNNASKLEIELEKLLEFLKKMFNVKWRIEGNVFRLEHVSRYSKNIGFDITSNELKKYFVGKRIYSYENNKIPEKEIFKFKEQEGGDWNMEIIYSGCVLNKKKNEITYLIDDATTDIVFAIQNPSPDSKLVEDAGFCIVSTKKIGNEYFINSEPSPVGSRLNNVFAWVQLIRDFHYYERPMKTGKVNGTTTEFISTIPTKKGERFAIPYNVCQYDFNPDDIVKTLIGNGIVSSAKHRFKDYFLEFELLYESNQDLSPNIPPTLSGGGTFSTYQETPLTLDVIADDADGTISALQIKNSPNNGSINIVSTSQFTYTPNAGFIGMDFFSLIARDNYSEVSNSQTFIINVKQPNQAPVANDDEFIVYNSEPFNQVLSIFANDTDDNGFTLETTSTTSTEGISISIDSNGFFNYSPNAGFEGIDTFQYSIKDDANLISTATVTLKIIDKNKPIAVEDNYQTSKNTNITTDGTIGREKVTANDYTPNGSSYTYSTTAETKATTNGGNVAITTDGNFVYTPPTDFVGIDSFDYTVTNPNGSSSGLVKIAVNPTIYVKMTTNDNTVQGIVGQSQWTKKRDYYLNFFSDASGTIPFDVTGLNFKVKIKEHQKNEYNGSVTENDYIYFTNNLIGTQTKILDDFYYFERYYDENNFVDTEVTIEPFNYIIIN